MVIKRLSVIFMSIIMICSFASCSNSVKYASSDTKSSKVDITAKEILEKTVEETGDKNLDSSAFYGEDLYKDNCVKLYGIEYSDIEDGGIVYAGSGGLADEVSIIRTIDMDESVARKYLENRVQRRIQDFTGYKPEEISKIENSIVFSQNGFSVLIISDDSKQIRSQVEKLIGK